MNTKEFPIEVVLSCIYGKLLCKIDDVYECLNWLYDENFFTHQLPNASRSAQPLVEKQHPFLKEIHLDDINPDNWQEKVTMIQKEWGKTVKLTKIGNYNGSMFGDLVKLSK